MNKKILAQQVASICAIITSSLAFGQTFSNNLNPNQTGWQNNQSQRILLQGSRSSNKNRTTKLNIRQVLGKRQGRNNNKGSQMLLRRDSGKQPSYRTHQQYQLDLSDNDSSGEIPGHLLKLRTHNAR